MAIEESEQNLPTMTGPTKNKAKETGDPVRRAWKHGKFATRTEGHQSCESPKVSTPPSTLSPSLNLPYNAIAGPLSLELKVSTMTPAELVNGEEPQHNQSF